MRNLTLSAGGLNSLSCLQHYKFSRIERLSLKDRDSRESMDRGSLGHFLLENYYNRIIDNPEVDKLSLVEELLHLGNIRCINLAVTDEERDKTFNAFRQYIQHWVKRDWVPVRTEAPVSKVLFEDTELDIRVILEGRIDLIARTDDLHIVVDHKTEERKNTYNKRDNQFLLYAWITGLSNVVVNVVGIQKTVPPDEKFRRITFSYFPWNIEEWVEATKVKVLRLVKAIELGYFERNIEQCKWCPYQAICDAKPERRQHIIETQYSVSARYDLYASSNS